MSERAKRVAALYLKKSQTPETPETSGVLSDQEIMDSISESLEVLYTTYILQKFKSLDITHKLPVLSRLVRHLGESSEQEFYSEINQLMNRFYRILKNSVMGTNSSVKTKLFNEIKKEKISDSSVIDDYIRSEFKKYMIDSERQTNIFINKPLL